MNEFHWARAQVDFVCPVCETDGGASQATMYLDEADGWQIVCPNDCDPERVFAEMDFMWVSMTVAAVSVQAMHAGHAPSVAP